MHFHSVTSKNLGFWTEKINIDKNRTRKPQKAVKQKQQPPSDHPYASSQRRTPEKKTIEAKRRRVWSCILIEKDWEWKRRAEAKKKQRATTLQVLYSSSSASSSSLDKSKKEKTEKTLLSVYIKVYELTIVGLRALQYYENATTARTSLSGLRCFSGFYSCIVCLALHGINIYICIMALTRITNVSDFSKTTTSSFM